jgi:hypothetical protein
MSLTTRVRNHHRQILALVALLCFALPCRAQAGKPKITAIFRGITPERGERGEGVLRYHYDENEQSRWIARVKKEGEVLPNKLPTVGRVTWVIPETNLATGGLDRDMRTYSAEAPIGLGIGKLYQYQILHPDIPRVFGWDDNPDNRAKAKKRGVYIRELYGRFYQEGEEDNDAARAFQVALWEIIHETSPTFDLKEGAFQADYPDFAAAPAFVQKAQGYLQKLEGDTSPFDLNLKLVDLTLVYLKGEPTPDNQGYVGQSQLALSHIPPETLSGGPAAGPGTSFVSSGNSGNSGQGSPSSGLAGSGSGFGSNTPLGSGGGGGGAPGTPSNSSIGSPSQAPTVGGGGVGSGGAGAPDSGAGGTNNGGDPNPPPTPVSAPAGVVLGLAAISAFAAHNRVRRTFRKK